MPEWGELQVDQLRHMARRVPDEAAYRDLATGSVLTFAEWDERSNRMARFLATRGVTRGDRVSVYLPSEEVLRWVVAYAAVHKAGAVAVPTNTRLSTPELATILDHAEIRAAITCDALHPDLLAIRNDVASLRLVVSDHAERSDAASTGPAWDDATWTDAMEVDGSDFQVPVDLDDLADIMYTSGTTGRPKGVAARHRTVAMIPNNEPVWTGGGWLHGAPLFTFAGIAFIFNPMKMGMVGLYLPRFDADHWLEIVEVERPVMAFLVPAMAELLVAHPRFEEPDLSSLAVVSIGSAPLAPATLQRLQERLAAASVTNSYGMTEAGPAFIVMPRDEAARRIGSVGRPIGGMEVRIVGDDARDAATGDVGEVWTRMAGRQREYYKDDAATAATWTADGWLRSGDLGYLDDDGFLYLVGRKKDLIIRGGHNIYPTDVEAVLLEHPEVQEAAVVGIPHDVLGEDVAAFVVPQPGRDLDADSLAEFCATRLADYKRPRRLVFVDALPRNATGKVMKHRLIAPQG